MPEHATSGDRAWNEFAAYLLVRRAHRPPIEALEPDERQQGEILADVFAEWLRTNATRFEPAPRGWLKLGPPPRQHFLYETGDAGLAVLRDRQVSPPDGVTLVAVDELQEWRDDHPEEMAALYPIVSSFFTPSVPTSLYKRALARHPLRPNEVFYLHCRSVWLTPSSGHGTDDLWKSDGDHMTLLTPRFSHWKT